MRFHFLYSTKNICKKRIRISLFMVGLGFAFTPLSFTSSEIIFPKKSKKKYFSLIAVNNIASWLMVSLFLWKGYFVGSIIASSIVLFIGFIFFFFLLNDLKGIKHIAKYWFLCGLFFAMLSSIGVFGLVYMKVTHQLHRDFYLASTYYYLHFQYNGFFIFSCIGILLNYFKDLGAIIPEKANQQILKLMFLGCVIGYGLSVLWLRIPIWIFVIIVLGSIFQTIGAVKLYNLIKTNWKLLLEKRVPKIERWALIISGAAFALKILLQLGSNIPEVSQFAFGFRNIVIAYLHLVLLMCIAVFLLNQILGTGLFKTSNKLYSAFFFLLVGIILNELVLGVMGIFSIKYISLPYAANILLGVSILMMLSLFFIWTQLKTSSHK